MDTNLHELADLFAQLGLPNDEASIRRFVDSHNLPAGMPISQASFWTPAQAALLAESLGDDADWAVVADRLALLLSHGA